MLMNNSCAKTPERKMTLQIAVNMTTPPAVLLSATAPALLGILLAIESVGRIPPVLTVCLLLIPTLMNAAVDVLNDYFDYISGNDSHENIVSESDAPLAYHQVENPKPALWFGIGLFVIASLMGTYVIAVSGMLPAIIGVVGGIVAITYSGTKVATSYLPIGEPLAGFTMGGLIPLGVYAALTGEIDGLILYKAIPMMLIVSQFMLINNACDMERDKIAGRRTLPIVIGQKNAQTLANILNLIWMVQLFHVVITWYSYGVMIILGMLLIIWKNYRRTFQMERTHENKIPVTAALACVAAGVAVAYPLAVAVHLLLV